MFDLNMNLKVKTAKFPPLRTFQRKRSITDISRAGKFLQAQSGSSCCVNQMSSLFCMKCFTVAVLFERMENELRVKQGR